MSTQSAALALVLWGFSGVAVAAPPVDPGGPHGLHVHGVASGGAGCPSPDTTTSIVADDGSSFLLLFDAMQLAYPPAPVNQSLACAASIEIELPEGWRLSLGSVTTRGYAFLDPKIRARISSRYFLDDDAIAYRPHAVIHGPLDELYDFDDKIPFAAAIWSTCGGTVRFTVETTLMLDADKNPGGQALLSTDAADGAFQQVYHWKWKKC